MKIIEIASWKRKSHFEFFKNFDTPKYSLSINSDITNLYNYAKKNNISFFLLSLYAILKAANNIKEFRQRLVNNQVVEFEKLVCSTPIMTKDDLYKSVVIDYYDSFKEFYEMALPIVNAAKSSTPCENGTERERDDIIIASCLPWFSFTNLNSALLSFKSCSIPVITWGKFQESNDRLLVPISFQLSHLFVDGIHVGHYIKLLEEYFNNPESL